MDQFSQFFQQFDWSIVTGVLLFGLGYLFNEYLRHRSEKRRIKNLKTVVFWELTFNKYHLQELVEVLPVSLENNFKIETVILNLEHSIFDSSLSRVDMLKEKELSTVLFAYKSIKSLIRTFKDYRTYIFENIGGKDTDDYGIAVLDKKNKYLSERIVLANDLTAQALAVFQKGREDLLAELQGVNLEEIHKKYSTD